MVGLHWSQKGPNTTVWTDSRQGSRNQKHYCLCQRLYWNWYDWNVISLDCLAPTKWVCFEPTVWSDTCWSLHRIGVSVQCSYRYGHACRIECSHTCLRCMPRQMMVCCFLSLPTPMEPYPKKAYNCFCFLVSWFWRLLFDWINFVAAAGCVVDG